MRRSVLVAVAVALAMPAQASADGIRCGNARYREAMKQRPAMKPVARCQNAGSTLVQTFAYAGCRAYSQVIRSEHSRLGPVTVGHRYYYSGIAVFNRCTGRFERSR